MAPNDVLSKSFIKRWAHRFDVNRAVGFAVLMRAWQLLSGPITPLLITLFFTQQIQGVYYLFVSLVGFQALVELGFHWVIVHHVAHDAAGLSIAVDGRLTGPNDSLSRLASLLSIARRWFAVASVLFAIVVSIVGVWLLKGDVDVDVWGWPFALLVLTMSSALAISPYLSILEGCNQMWVVNRYRFWQAITGSVVVWTTIVLGMGIWAAVLSCLVQLAFEIIIVWGHYRHFWSGVAAVESGPQVDWRSEIWPLQWRRGLQAMSHWFAFGLIVPIVFKVEGSEVSGRIGMTWAILTAFQNASFAWISNRAASMGQLVAEKKKGELDELFHRLVFTSTSVLVTLSATFTIGVFVIGQLSDPFSERFASRLLPWIPTALFSVGAVLLHLPHCWGMYVRSHRVEPFLRISVSANILLGMAMWGAVLFSGITAASLTYAVVVATVTTPGIYRVYARFRRQQDELPILDSDLDFESDDSQPEAGP